MTITFLITWSTVFTLQNQLNKANMSDIEATFLDLHLSISDVFVKTNIYDKRDDFDFDVANFPFLDGDVPHSTSYSVYIYINITRNSNKSNKLRNINTIGCRTRNITI